MTEQEAKDFFEQVKGKKIKFRALGSGLEYFIPEYLEICIPYYIMRGTECYEEIIDTGSWFVGDAFNEWEFCEKESIMSNPGYSFGKGKETLISLKKHKCTCSSLDLFRFGCKCGGI